jgi:hypothetical protein
VPRRPTQMHRVATMVRHRCRPPTAAPGRVGLAPPACTCERRVATSLRSRSSSARSSAERLGVSHMADTVLVCMSRCLGCQRSRQLGRPPGIRHHLKRVISSLGAVAATQDARLAAVHLLWAMPAPPREARVASSGLWREPCQPGGGT